jgi:hypothetical protein
VRSGAGSYAVPGDNLAQLQMHLHRGTELAVLMSDDGDKKNAKWLPRSQLTMTPVKNSRWIYTVTMPEWLAHKHGLI